ncbi:Uncharacterized protein pbN1_32210 [Aromatoleum bremense]|nr:Uncharacterized protein pbN1_32210 [Aromatoleum bremense]
MPFNPLTGDLNDLRITHGHCWLWPQITAEFDRLDAVVFNARAFLEPLTTAGCTDWAQQAAIGIVRSNLAIHQHAEHHGSYIAAARSLWTARIPRDPPTLSDAQIFALMAINEARLTAETYCEIAAGIEDEMQQSGIGYNDAEDIHWLRSDIAGWERELWRDAADRTGTAEKFMLMANFAANVPDPAALKKAESQLATLQRKARTAKAEVGQFRQGRLKGAVGRLTRALAVIAREAGSTELADVLRHLEAVAGEDIEGVRIQEVMDGRLWYLDVVANREQSIAMDSLKRKLAKL